MFTSCRPTSPRASSRALLMRLCAPSYAAARSETTTQTWDVLPAAESRPERARVATSATVPVPEVFVAR
jgi:hypothetical protein